MANRSRRHRPSAFLTGLALLGGLTTINARTAPVDVPGLPGWLYVLGSDHGRLVGHISTIDLARASVVRTFMTGYKPDVVQSMDGRHLYVASDVPAGVGQLSGVLDVVDATSGEVVKRVRERESRGGMPGVYQSRMALSRDGTLLYRYKHWRSEEGVESQWLAVFDTARNVPLAGRVELPLCGEATIQPLEERGRVAVVCPASSDVRIVSLSRAGNASTTHIVSVGPGMREGFSPVVFTRDEGRTVTIVKTDGSFVVVDTGSKTVVERDLVDRVARRVPAPGEPRPGIPQPSLPVPDDWFQGRVIPSPPAFALSPDGTRVYVLSNGSQANEVVVFEAVTLQRLAAMPMDRRYESIAISLNGAELFAVDMDTSSLVVMEASSGKVRARISGLARSPVIAVVAR